MSTLDLRRLDKVLHRHQQRVRRWAQQGRVAHLNCPARSGSYLMFSSTNAHGTWRAILDAHQWLEYQLPQWVALLAGEQHGQAALALFSSMNRPFEAGVADLDYAEFQEVSLVSGEGLGKQSLASLQIPSGTLWLQAFEPVLPVRSGPLAQWVRDIPMTLRSKLGYSRIDGSIIARLAIGDLLIVGESGQRLFMGSRCIGHFTLNPEGLVMNLDAEPYTDVSPEDATPQEAALGSALALVEFVIDERSMSLAQLSAWMPGEVLALEPDAACRVRVLVNDIPVAMGELVQLDSGLGVELHTLLRGLPDE